MEASDGLVFAYRLDGNGGGTSVGWDEVRAWDTEQGPVWVHLNYRSEDVRRWILEESGVDEVVGEALLAEETRPRCVATRDGLLLILRGVNLNPGADPDDMVSIRLWVERHRVLTMRHRKVMAVQDIREELATGEGPVSEGDFLVDLCSRLITRMGPALEDIDDGVDDLEDQVLTAESRRLRAGIGEIRRQAIRIRRYLAPQRDVMGRLPTERATWLDELHRSRLRELADRVTRYVEDLDAARDRAAVIQDELNSRLSEQMSKTMYVLSIVAAIFLPLGLLTGLLGVNVAGIPGTDNPSAFVVVCVLLLLLAIVQGWIFRRMGWI